MTIAAKLLKRISGRRGASPSLDSMLAQFDKELENFPSLVQPAPESRPRTPFDNPNLSFDQMWVSRMTPRQLASVLPIMAPLMWQMRRSARLYDGTFAPTRSEADPHFLAQLEQVGRAAGARAITYVNVPPNAIFKHKGIPHDFAVVITVEMDREKIATSPSFASFREVARGYKNLAVIGNKMAAFMRRSGFAAYPGTALGGITDYVHLAELAGLGAIGYHGLLISPEEGARLRINTIYTNITNLPIETHNPHLWVRDFCAMCKKCIRKCPVQAIFPEPRPRGDGGMQCIDHDACRDYFGQNYGCAVCLAVCPFSDVGYARVKARFKGNLTAPQFRIPVAPAVAPPPQARVTVTDWR